VKPRKYFACEIYARENKEASFARMSLCIYARQIFTRFALGIVFCEQNETTFEVTDASFCVATCQAYEQVQ
jgi:AAA+ superfamily predicted ATPase